MASKRVPAPRVLWDTSILIWCLDNAPDPLGLKPDEIAFRKETRELVRGMLLEAETRQIQIVVSAFGILECRTPDRSKARDAATQTRLIEDFLRHKYFVRASVDSAIAHRARAIILDTTVPVDVYNEDLTQLATAVEHSIPEFITTDGDMLNHDPRKQERRAKKGLLAFSDKLKLADGSGMLKIWTPRERKADKDAKYENRKALEATRAEAGLKGPGGMSTQTYPLFQQNQPEKKPT